MTPEHRHVTGDAQVDEIVAKLVEAVCALYPERRRVFESTIYDVIRLVYEQGKIDKENA